MKLRSSSLGRAALGLPLGLVLLGASSWCTAQDKADLDATQIIGNRELPKVLYIVPWKKPIGTEFSGRPPSRLMDEVLAPLDRDVFRRQMSLNPPSAPSAAAGSVSPRP
jgi:hypothetical protein